VTFGSFSARELPVALWRMVSTRDFILCAGIPAVLLLLWKFVLQGSPVLETAGMVIAGLSVVWLVTALIWILRFGKTYGIGCNLAGEDPEERQRAGGLRFKFARRQGMIRIAGILVDPGHRKKGVFTALLLALFRMALVESQKAGGKHTPLRLSMFAPGHPASKHVVRTYFDNHQTLMVDSTENSSFSRSLKRLEGEIGMMKEKGVGFTFLIRSFDGDLIR
jgi:GNAT superfamily N-acetyltransferase